MNFNPYFDYMMKFCKFSCIVAYVCMYVYMCVPTYVHTHTYIRSYIYIFIICIDVCQCPDSISSSSILTGANNTMSIDILSVCSGKPCQYGCEKNLNCQVIAVANCKTVNHS